MTVKSCDHTYISWWPKIAVWWLGNASKYCIWGLCLAKHWMNKTDSLLFTHSVERWSWPPILIKFWLEIVNRACRLINDMLTNFCSFINVSVTVNSTFPMCYLAKIGPDQRALFLCTAATTKSPAQGKSPWKILNIVYQIACVVLSACWCRARRQ